MFETIVSLVVVLINLLNRKGAPPCYISKAVREWEKVWMPGIDDWGMWFSGVEYEVVRAAYKAHPFTCAFARKELRACRGSAGMRRMRHPHNVRVMGGAVVIRALPELVKALHRLPKSEIRDYLIGKCGGDIFAWTEVAVLEGFVSLRWYDGTFLLEVLKKGGHCSKEQEEAILATSKWEKGEDNEDGWYTSLKFPVYWEEGNRRIKLGKLFAQLAKKQGVEGDIIQATLDDIAQATFPARRLIVSRCMGDIWNLSTGHGFTSCLNENGCHAKGAAWAAMNGDMVAYTVALDAKPGVTGPWLSRIHLRHDQHGRFCPEDRSYGSMAFDPEIKEAITTWLKGHDLLGGIYGMQHALYAARAGYSDQWRNDLGSNQWIGGWSKEVRYDERVIAQGKVVEEVSFLDDGDIPF